MYIVRSLYIYLVPLSLSWLKARTWLLLRAVSVSKLFFLLWIQPSNIPYKRPLLFLLLSLTNNTLHTHTQAARKILAAELCDDQNIFFVNGNKSFSFSNSRGSLGFFCKPLFLTLSIWHKKTDIRMICLLLQNIFCLLPRLPCFLFFTDILVSYFFPLRLRKCVTLYLLRSFRTRSLFFSLSLALTLFGLSLKVRAAFVGLPSRALKLVRMTEGRMRSGKEESFPTLQRLAFFVFWLACC